MYQLLWYDAVQEAARAVRKRLLACEPTLSTIFNRLHVCADVMNAAAVGVTHEVPRLDDLAWSVSVFPATADAHLGPISIFIRLPFHSSYLRSDFRGVILK
jgi:hypothetical protein